MNVPTSTFNHFEMNNNWEALGENVYPGRGMIMGVAADPTLAVQTYWLMGRSPNSQNRILEPDEDIVRTAPFDESKVEDPSLIIYNAMDVVRYTKAWRQDLHVVSNGNQTDDVAIRLGGTSEIPMTSFRRALFHRSYEPDEPIFTPRITGMLDLVPGSNPSIDSYNLSIIRRNPYTQSAEHTFEVGTLDEVLLDGSGLCLHTYDSDGEIPPTFSGHPYPVPILGESAEEIAQETWANLNPENRVSLVTKTIDRITGEVALKIINMHEETNEAA